ncbi:glycoside hydrolase family 71/99-like protein [Streptomyces sp. NPDC050560]|uniref:glycoside hydrolase family 71/99-like protein n=1 Tax=Streptomyces sp. NPDC050560 TaxID=3365630 RepID=UPI00379D2906
MHRRQKTMFRTTLALGAASGLIWAGFAAVPPAGAAPTASGESAARAAAAPSVKGKVYAGYQGWFAAAGDGSPVNAWQHWASGTPAPGNQSFELYPDVSAYPDSALHQTGYAALGDGQPSKLFSSYADAVVDQHFKWMQQYGIDGAAIQRFGGDFTSPGNPRNLQKNGITQKARTAAEKYGRGFYVEYDISGLTDDNLVSSVQKDWTDTVTGSMKPTDSAAYAHQDGRPVVELWGIGVSGRSGTPDQFVQLVNWFKERGVYVIGGVPRGWRTDTSGFAPAYDALDMVSPWNVGNKTVDDKLFADDEARLEANGQDYQPVIFPGFAWSNWHEGSPKNEIPRDAGQFLWDQALGVRKAGANSAFVAMFDEYDEGTAIAPAAEDASMIPTNQYFLTLDADGKHMSSDFYLRLAAAATKMINGSADISETVPIPLEN